MCDQTEISYLDGDVVWVKLGPCWWPGQVTGVDNLPDDIQHKLKKKPLIAAVKFFQEDTYEFVKNIQQIYQYNCTQKDDFIKKGLDKYRSRKSKDGSNYMDKFPGDVEMAEKLTGGDPDILTSPKFCPEQKPDISSLFGEKKMPKRKKDKEDASRRSVSRENVKKITHPRFIGRKSDHEVRIRQQASSSVVSTPKSSDSSANLYSCPLCNFTSTRVNVIICHNKSHRSGGFETPPVRRTSPLKIRSAGVEPQKRKYVRKNKSLSEKLKIERDPETPKRKYTKQSNEKSAKKKKMDPEVNEKLLKEKLLADWDDGSDEDMDFDLDVSNPENPPSSPLPKKSLKYHNIDDGDDDSDGHSSDVLKESDKFLKETDKFSIALKSPNNRLDMDSDKEKSRSPLSKKPKKLIEEMKVPSPEKDDKKSKLSCFDFEEEEEPEPTFPPARKIPRVSGEKNTSLKKEIIKEFTKSQARANEKVAEEKTPTKQKPEIKHSESINNIKAADDDKLNDEINQTVNEATELVAKIAEETETSNLTKSKSEATETELEIVEILEVERDKEEDEDSGEILETKKSDDSIPKSIEPPKEEEEKMEESENSKIDDEDSGRVTIETEDETMEISQMTGTSASSGLGDVALSHLSDIIGTTGSESSQDTPLTPDVPEKPVRRRGRPRKTVLPVNVSGNGDSSTKIGELQPPGTPDSQDFDRKTSESEGERSYTGRRRKPNKKYLESETYSSSPGRRTPRTDDSQSETEEKPPKDQKRGKRGRKPSGINKNIRKSLEEYEFSDQTLDSAEESAVAAVAMSPGPKSPIKTPDISKKREIMSPVNITDLLATSDVEIRENQTPERSLETKINKEVASNDKIVHADGEITKTEKLPPKKSHIKKFEQSKLDFVDSGEKEETEKVSEDLETELNQIMGGNEKQESLENALEEIQMETTEVVESEETIIKETIENIVVDENKSIEETPEENLESLEEEKEIKSNSQVDVPEVLEERVETIEEIAMVPEEIPKPEEQEAVKVESVPEKAEAEANVEEVITEEEVTPPTAAIATETVPESIPVSSESPEIPTSPKKIIGSPKKTIGAIPKPVENLQKPQEGSIPVKKREKPRIIENVALKEPMQILKSKLLEKQPPKSQKHKLDSDMSKKLKAMGIPPPKMMKIDSQVAKTKTPSKFGSGQLSIPQKLQVLKAEEARNEAKNEQVLGNASGIISLPSSGSQNLQEMELDINSIPFVLSEDLNPDNIEQMPVMLSGIISSANPSTATTITFTQPTQSLSQQIQLGQKMGDIIPEASPAKKKTASPAILKNKGKAKPTITSIKTLNPPLTGGVKGLKFQNPQGKTLPVMSQKASPGKYVIVQQTPGGQQVRYTVQGKPGMTQKVAIPHGKSPNNPQIVQQGGKVVILTSPQMGPTKILSRGVQKVTPNKVQKVMGSKGQIYSQISPKIVPKTDTNSPTTSKLNPGQKLISPHQGIVGHKMYTQTKTVLMSDMGKNKGNLPKGTVFASVAAPGLTQKTIMGQKTLMTKDGQILGTISSQPGHKTILAPISQSSLVGKNLKSGQSFISAKGTVLTPITGQQVKAIAAKTPGKNMKMQYQSLQQKVQLPMLQKCQKVPIPQNANAGMRVAGPARSPSGTVMYQNAGQSPQGTFTKISTQGKKIIRQNIVSQAGKSPIATATSPQMANKANFTTTPVMQKVAVPRGRSSKPQQKYLVQKMQDSSPNTSSPTKTAVSSTVTKLSASPKAMMATSPVLKNVQKTPGTPKMTQKHVSSPLVASSISTAQTPLQIPEKSEITPEEALETLSRSTTNITEPKAEVLVEGAKSDDQKVPHQPQIMALPTESADGTQTYVLVTIDEQGTIHPLDNNALMSLEGTTTNPDGTRTLYIDPGSLGDAGGLDNIVLQFDGAAGSTLASGTSETPQTSETESFTSSNQDILAAALANTDFQGEIGLPEAPGASVIAPGITQTSLINQTILQSTIIPTSEPISSPSVLETSLTLNQPIMSAVEVPSNISIAPQTTSTTVGTVPTSLELPISITPGLSYIAVPEEQIQLPGNSMPDIGELMEPPQVEGTSAETEGTSEFLVLPNSGENIAISEESTGVATVEPTSSVSYTVSIPEDTASEAAQAQTTPSMPIIDDSFVDTNELPTKLDETTELTTGVAENSENPGEFSEVSVSEMLVPKTQVAQEVQEEIQEQPETTQHTRDMPDVIETEGTLPKDDAEVLNSDVVDSCMSAENSCLPAESSEEVQSSEKIIIESSETPEVSLSSQEAEASEKKELVEEVSGQVEAMEIDEAPYNPEEEIKQSAESSSIPEVEQMETNEIACGQDVVDAQPEQEIPTQSFEQFKIADNDENESPSQSVEKSSDSREPSQSEADESMEVSVEPPSQSFEDSTGQEASQSFQESSEVERSDQGNSHDDPSFPTQSYEVEKVENVAESLETDGELSQEGNIPSQSNDIGADGIGTSTFSNLGNDDETASSSYVPETPETQERDQDQESAISTSSYEIPPCDEINIASSSLIPDTSGTEHASIHDNGVPEIPTSSYNLNPDSSSTHVDSVPSSSFEDQVVIEQNVSTSYEVPISMPGVEENSSGNFVSESSDQRNEPSSYYATNPEEVTSEASQSYFVPEGPSPSYTSQNVSPSYYDAPQETEASQSFYSTQEIERTEQSSSINVEASQSFYQENSDELRLRQQGEATPTYTERYPVDYTLENSPIERHDLVESSVPASRPAER